VGVADWRTILAGNLYDATSTTIGGGRRTRTMTATARARVAIIIAAVGLIAARAANDAAHFAIAPTIEAIQVEHPGISLRGIAKSLDDRGERTRYGNEWSAAQIRRAQVTS